jgi:hypothetical protein
MIYSPFKLLLNLNAHNLGFLIMFFTTTAKHTKIKSFFNPGLRALRVRGLILLSQRKPVLAFQGSTGAMRSPFGRKFPVTCGNSRYFLQRAEYF